jgi:hypothetical protein
VISNEGCVLVVWSSVCWLHSFSNLTEFLYKVPWSLLLSQSVFMLLSLSIIVYCFVVVLRTGKNEDEIIKD